VPVAQPAPVELLPPVATPPVAPATVAPPAPAIVQAPALANLSIFSTSPRVNRHALADKYPGNDAAQQEYLKRHKVARNEAERQLRENVELRDNMERFRNVVRQTFLEPHPEAVSGGIAGRVTDAGSGMVRDYFSYGGIGSARDEGYIRAQLADLQEKLRTGNIHDLSIQQKQQLVAFFEG
jgi:hypothetical protein